MRTHRTDIDPAHLQQLMGRMTESLAKLEEDKHGLEKTCQVQ